MDTAEEVYKTIKQRAFYRNLTPVNEILVTRFEADKTLKTDTYFVYGMYISQKNVNMDLIT